MVRRGSKRLARLRNRLLTLLGYVPLRDLAKARSAREAQTVESPVMAGPETSPLDLTLLGASRPDQCGALPLYDGVDAMVARLALIRSAKHCIDVQYYLFRHDEVGKLLIWQLLEAADRGVRIRLLLDDTTGMRQDAELRALSSHPQISVRLFNPARLRRWRSLSLLSDFARLNHRMHNKSLTVDGLLAIVGGRNIGREYFGADTELEFGDLDCLLTGPVVQQVSTQFNAFWDGPDTFGIETIRPEDDLGLAALQDDIERARPRLDHSPYLERLASSSLLHALSNRDLGWYWGPASVLSDPAHKARQDSQRDWLIMALAQRMRMVKKQLVIISPYFVPSRAGLELLTSLRNRGVAIRVITNSLAATDVPLVHGKYRGYRRALLQAGVEIYELKSQVRRRRRVWRGSRASLHAKSFVFDDAGLFVGSFNFDPRSAWLNTEMGVMLETPALVANLDQVLSGILARQAYQLIWDAEGMGWRDPQTARVWRREPEAGVWRRLLVTLLAWLPIEKLL
ncbi:phospholipase D-like domain-containing protein [Shewanella cyperi]|uniref:phospholipase D-like domain-containing protein n=1 Tax=Shewanella cyperi TaxID=2814292 RepID=UPI001A940207|nr:phospholipase D family protein [Shewanella cyperi]QSX39606.1 phospholipase D family protein [Shewanella cyperi]